MRPSEASSTSTSRMRRTAPLRTQPAAPLPQKCSTGSTRALSHLQRMPQRPKPHGERMPASKSYVSKTFTSLSAGPRWPRASSPQLKATSVFWHPLAQRSRTPTTEDHRILPMESAVATTSSRSLRPKATYLRSSTKPQSVRTSQTSATKRSGPVPRGSYPTTFILGARNASKVLEGSRVLGHSGYGHGIVARPSSCVYNYITAYFVNGTLPAPGTHCKPDMGPWEMAKAQAKN